MSDHDAPQQSAPQQSDAQESDAQESDTQQSAGGGRAPSGLRASLDDSRRRRRRGLLAGVGVAVAAALVGGGFWAGTAVGGADAQAAGSGGSGERLSVRIAGSGESDLQDAVRTVAAEEGLDVTWVNFDDWTLTNSALVAGEVDANAFQHTAFLSAYNVANDTDLTPVFSTTITQWGVFSATLDSIEDIGQGARIAIPDDASNGGRALFILQAAGLIELGPDVGVYPTVDDVTGNDLGLEFVPIGATTIPTQFDDPSLDAVVVGTSYFDPSQDVDADDALYLDDSLSAESRPYVNAVVTRADDADDEAWTLLADAYADPRVADALEEESFGATQLVDVSAADLRSTLAELETAARELDS
ncbi:MetQ/NlpA family ABC transporter substrate-binding protein [Frigoribacterium sp. CFBP9030]|uniref:MetQ/NlpA family ABC transporter substrate-binding protein n=1 Tax=Frigoribacterium sp. CFBP9030 TaxID=3096537 RepID=UPI002A69EEB6|nr:MetQ/NlpA family ABC transporter substrate-binding protein [Frigoribacterium sp. CFBP9030]MDY0892487.1 MetQ/NlpA family ABC transporter substrate-binding protein [Frigoribacterium sp. CFBP9030]